MAPTLTTEKSTSWSGKPSPRRAAAADARQPKAKQRIKKPETPMKTSSRERLMAAINQRCQASTDR
ncbi:hypothetical protein D3C72_2549850 [compost metagenome]